MSWQCVLAILTGVIAVISALVMAAGFVSDNEDMTGIGFIVFAVTGVITGALLVLGSTTIVGTRQIAIQTSFGKPTGDALNNGLHWKKPWTITHEMDGAIQIDQYKGDHRILVRLGNSSTAFADVSIRWIMKQEAAPELFRQYKTFDNVRVNLVERNLAVALNEAFAKFDPLAEENLNESPLPALASQVTEILRAEVGDQVEILDTNIPTVSYDEGTEERINQLNQQRAQTAIAKEAKETALKQAEANRAISDSISNDPNVVVNNCITATVAKGISPLGCWPGSGAVPTVPAR